MAIQKRNRKDRLVSKAGNPQFKSAPPQLRNIADNQVDCGVAALKKLRNYDCGPSKFDFLNSATLCSLLPIPLLSDTFSSAQDGFKNQPKIFLELSVSLETKKLALKGQFYEIFTSDFFFMNPKQIPRQKYAEDCGLEVADIRKYCDCGIAELRLRSNISFKSCGIAIAEVRPSNCGIAIADSKKSCACPPVLVSMRNSQAHMREKL